ncbi:MAG: class I SAM-dependent methyltransferase [Syntrophotaleaceae bacterium]
MTKVAEENGADQNQKDLLAFYRYDSDHPFAGTYPLLARQMVEDYGVTRGLCLDIGTGGGPMLIELAKLTDLELVGIDLNPAALALADENVRRHGLEEKRFQWRQGDVHSLPLPDCFASFVISRGSIPFWDDHALAFREIYRVLRPNGLAVIGGGFSRYQSPEEISRLRPGWARKDNPEKRARWLHAEFLENALRDAGVPSFKIVEDFSGIWAVFCKSSGGLSAAEGETA